MTEKLFHAELLAALRAAGAWAMKWPDQATSRMQLAGDGHLRFTLPKPCDLIGVWPGGRALAIECKLVKAMTLRVDARLVRQAETLRDIARRGAYAALAVNFRVVTTRNGRVNRAFLAPVLNPDSPALIEGHSYPLERLVGVSVELVRRSGGWIVECPA